MKWQSVASMAGVVLVAGVAIGEERAVSELREFTLEISLKRAAEVAAKIDDASPEGAIERARLSLYRADCEGAATLLARPDIAETEGAALLGAVSRGCVRTMAGSVVVEDAPRGVWMRFQDDADQVLAPLLADVASRANLVFKDSLRTELETPIRIEVVRDQFGLAAMTGLPLEAARTTGTIAIAKWGRVFLVSPRGTPKGYAYQDTLAHELTHLALTRASRDRAPLWLQEGVARVEETRWRDPQPFDDLPRADDLAGFGIKKGIGPDIDKIGPSIALLPSAEEAQITYAKVMSFIRYYAKETGNEGLPKLLTAMREKGDADEVQKTIELVSGKSFADWATAWKAHVSSVAKDMPDELRPGAPASPKLPEARRRVRLGQLFMARDHARAASIELARAVPLVPHEAIVRAELALALYALGKTDEAKAFVDKAEDVMTSEPRWWMMRALTLPDEREKSIGIALSIDPYSPVIPCENLKAPAVPTDAVRRAICEAARRKPRAD
jgi:hypothetical protein